MRILSLLSRGSDPHPQDAIRIRAVILVHVASVQLRNHPMRMVSETRRVATVT